MERADEEAFVTEPTLPGPTYPGPMPTGPAYPGPPPPGYGPPVPEAAPTPHYVDPGDKSRLTAGLLGIFLGAFGVHRFYLGYTSIGVLQILVTISTLGIGALWGIIEGILTLGGSGIETDADGRPLRP
jgi:hypothetical protein